MGTFPNSPQSSSIALLQFSLLSQQVLDREPQCLTLRDHSTTDRQVVSKSMKSKKIPELKHLHYANKLKHFCGIFSFRKGNYRRRCPSFIRWGQMRKEMVVNMFPPPCAHCILIHDQSVRLKDSTVGSGQFFPHKIIFRITLFLFSKKKYSHANERNQSDIWGLSSPSKQFHISAVHTKKLGCRTFWISGLVLQLGLPSEVSQRKEHTMVQKKMIYRVS